MRREWIEIVCGDYVRTQLPVSPSMRREWIEIDERNISGGKYKSPSMRREWIEMITNGMAGHALLVSLHAEGVD